MVVEKQKKYKHVASYSQFSMWNQCPYQWYLKYPEKRRHVEPSIHLLFGSAMHETLQAYVVAIYKKSAKFADSLDLEGILRYRMDYHYLNDQKVYNVEKPVTDEEFSEFYDDGVRIIRWLKKHRVEYFNSNAFDLIGIEIPLEEELVPGLFFKAFLDIVLQHKKTGDITVIDLKTSTKSWGDWKKKDENKTMQLVLYKHFYSKLYDMPMEQINVEFVILKRKLYEQSDWPQKRIQRFVPASGKPTINKTVTQFETFVKSCYTENGDYNLDGFYPKIATEHNCRFCDFTDKPDLCDKSV